MAMAQSARSLFSHGEISSKAAGKHGIPILRQTRVNPGFEEREEPFEGRQGRSDQGGLRARGDASVAGSHSINTKQSMGSPAHAGGKPSGPGRVASRGVPRALRGTHQEGGDIGPGAHQQPTRRAHIDAPGLQKPEFHFGPRSKAVKRGQFRTSIPGGGKPSPGSASAARPSSRGAPPMQKAGRQSGYYSADTRRP